MTLSEDIKSKITNEANQWLETQYAGKTLEQRKELGAFFTPAELVIQMIEKFENIDGTILDPTCGCGGLLAGCIIAGADPNLCYGIELDAAILNQCRLRLKKLGVPEKNLRHGNALNPDCYDFDLKDNEEYKFFPNKGPNGTVKIIKNGKEKKKFVFGFR